MSPCFPFVHMKSVWMFWYHTLLQSELQHHAFLVPERSHQASLKSVCAINQSRLVLNSGVVCNSNFHLPFHCTFKRRSSRHVNCFDRTNAIQFVARKAGFGRQLPDVVSRPTEMCYHHGQRGANCLRPRKVCGGVGRCHAFVGAKFPRLLNTCSGLPSTTTSLVLCPRPSARPS